MAENQALEERIERLEAIIQENGGEMPDESISRRSWLALLGGGAMGAGLMAGSEPASAKDFTAAGSGKLGTNANPAAEVNSVLGNFENVDAETIDTEGLSVGGGVAQMPLDGLFVPVAPGLGVSDAIDPSSTSTPLQDAIDTITASVSGGKVITPPGSFNEPSATTTRDTIMIEAAAPGFTTINYTSTGTTAHGLIVEGQGAAANQKGGLKGLNISGPGKTAGTGNALRFEASDPRDWNVDQTQFTDWDPDDGIVVGGGDATLFNSSWGSWSVFRSSGTGLSTDGDSGFFAGTFGPGTHLGLAFFGGGLDRALKLSGRGDISFDEVNIGSVTGGASNEAINTNIGAAGQFDLGQVNFEPAGAFTGNKCILSQGPGRLTYSGLKINGAGGGVTLDYAVQLTGTSGKKEFGPVINDATVNNALVRVVNDISNPMRYEGPQADVLNDTGGNLSNPVSCWDGNVT